MFNVTRRAFVRTALGGLALGPAACGQDEPAAASATPPPPENVSPVYHVRGIPDQPFSVSGDHHAGVDALVELMGRDGLKLFRSARVRTDSGPFGLLGTSDVVLVKVNAQWKHRGCTNSDVVRGLVRRILEHPDGFSGEVVILDNGQGRGSLHCDTSQSYGGDTSVHANANDETHTFRYLVDHVFADRRVSAYLLDPIRSRFISDDDHQTDGYRRFENVSYPCFTTAGGNRIELREGVWTGARHEPRLRLLNVPVLKHHDTGGSEITGAVKHFYGLVSMSDGNATRHYGGLGDTCGRMIASVRTPVLNVMDAIWVSHRALSGTPAASTFRANQLVASQDPVALDVFSARNILHPIDRSPRHAPDFAGIQAWLTAAEELINARGGLYKPEEGLLIARATRNEAGIRLLQAQLA